VPTIPYLFTFSFISLLPWNLHESTGVINPSYLLFGSIFFFIGFLEAVPDFSTNWFPSVWGFALMGFGIFWDMQFHFSWVLLPLFVVFAIFARRTNKVRDAAKSLGAFVLGLLPIAALILPTFLKYGWSHSAGGAGTAQFFNLGNFLAFSSFPVSWASTPPKGWLFSRMPPGFSLPESSCC
jgi:EamA domain-containing membrane protein RarD